MVTRRKRGSWINMRMEERRELIGQIKGKKEKYNKSKKKDQEEDRNKNHIRIRRISNRPRGHIKKKHSRSQSSVPATVPAVVPAAAPVQPQPPEEREAMRAIQGMTAD